MTEIDHVTHGWALLALKKPEIRTLSKHRRSIDEMCECYSIAVLHLRKLLKEGSDIERIDEYEELVAGIEEEVGYYFTNISRVNSRAR
jgi:hypothetical protein